MKKQQIIKSIAYLKLCELLYFLILWGFGWKLDSFFETKPILLIIFAVFAHFTYTAFLTIKVFPSIEKAMSEYQIRLKTKFEKVSREGWSYVTSLFL